MQNVEISLEIRLTLINSIILVDSNFELQHAIVKLTFTKGLCIKNKRPKLVAFEWSMENQNIELNCIKKVKVNFSCKIYLYNDGLNLAVEQT